MHKILLASIFIFVLSFAVVSCSKEDEPTDYDCTGLTPTYATDIKPIFDASCAATGCHAATNPADGLDLSSNQFASEHNEHLLCTIEHLSSCEPMPQGGDKLDEATIKKISCWVENGRP